MGFELVRSLAHERIRHSAELSPRLAQLLDAGMTVGADAYDAAIAADRGGMGKARRVLRRVQRGADPGRARRGAAGLGYTGNPMFNRMWTLLGMPCVTLPAIWGESGLPTGIQLVGRIGETPGSRLRGVRRARAGRPHEPRPQRASCCCSARAALAGCGLLDPYPTTARAASRASLPERGSGSATTR